MFFSLHHSFLVDKLARRPARIDQAEISHLRSLFYRVLHVGLDDKPRSGGPPTYCNGDAELNFEDIPTLAFDDPRAVDFRNSLRTWFSRSSWSAISRAHLLSWLSWGMFNSSLESITEEQRAFVDEALVMTERRAGARLPDITNDKVLNGSAGGGPKTLRLSLDPISVSSRPLAAYVLINIAAVACGSWFEWKYGAQYKTMGGTKYVIFACHSSCDSASKAITGIIDILFALQRVLTPDPQSYSYMGLALVLPNTRYL